MAVRGTGPPSAGGARRLPALCALALLMAAVAPARAATFGLDDVAERARRLAEDPFRDAKGHVPDWLLNITYDQWRDIRFRPEQALWRDRGGPFQVQFFHPGLYYNRVVRVNVVEPKGVHPVEFSPNQFDYGKNDFASRVPQKLGYAGFRVHYPIRTRDYYDEIIVFLGASYLRAVGKEEGFGLSARALGIDTAESWGEEFPYFKEFWLVSPAPRADRLTVYALLDSPSLAGAYRFVIRPGEQTAVEVECRLFLRKEVRKLGIAPLTSMFYHGENTNRPFDDFRPEVHDSDGLLVHFDGGEWLWRPLDNPIHVETASFHARSPRGFGLMQRDRAFADYQDIETRSELRPSVWVEPHGDWGDGQIRLIELPTATELLDNVVAFWVPDAPPKPGDSLTYAYTLSWDSDDPTRPPGGRTVATRRDRGAANTPRDAYRWVLDFESAGLSALPAENAPRAHVSASRAARVFDEHVYKNPVTGGWRLAFQVKPKTDEPVELRAYLERQGDVLTETWSSVWLPGS